MRKPPHRSNVVALGGARRGDEVVSQELLRDLEEAQRAEWAASKRAALLSERVKAAITERNAQVEPGPLYFDEELEMVRTKKSARSAGNARKKREDVG